MDNTPATVKAPPEEPGPKNPIRTQPGKHSSLTNDVLKLKSRRLVEPTYKECMKNHAAAMGGHAIDGCGEFMPSTDSLRCVACGCHRNFHRRARESSHAAPHTRNSSVINRPDPRSLIEDPEPEFQPHHRHHPFPPPPRSPPSPPPISSAYPHPPPTTGENLVINILDRTIMKKEARVKFQSDHGHHPLPPQPRSPNSPSPRSPPPISSAYFPPARHMLLALSNPNPSSVSRKRFRTKFTQSQKTKMRELADKIGWRMQRRDEEVITDFCNGIGVEKGVFKVWMHNNKNTFGKKELATVNGSNGVGVNLDMAPTSDNYLANRNNLSGDVSANPVGTNGFHK